MENTSNTTTIEVSIDNEEKAAVVTAILANLDVYQHDKNKNPKDEKKKKTKNK